MYQQIEIVTLDSSIYYSKKVIENGTVLVVETYDTANDKVILTLEKISGTFNSLYATQYSVDVDKGLFYMSPMNTGSTIRITYYTEGEINPFYVSSNISVFTKKMLTWSENRICDGLYLYRSDTDENRTWHFKGGSFILEGLLYVVIDHFLDIRYMSPPTISNKYSAYYFYVNRDVVVDSLDNKTKILNKVGMLQSSSLYAKMSEAKTDVLGKYASTHTVDALPICFLYVMQSNNMYQYWVEYPSSGRVI